MNSRFYLCSTNLSCTHFYKTNVKFMLQRCVHFNFVLRMTISAMQICTCIDIKMLKYLNKRNLSYHVICL